jgi:hypothetical protein
VLLERRGSRAEATVILDAQWLTKIASWFIEAVQQAGVSDEVSAALKSACTSGRVDVALVRGELAARRELTREQADVVIDAVQQMEMCWLSTGPAPQQQLVFPALLPPIYYPLAALRRAESVDGGGIIAVRCVCEVGIVPPGLVAMLQVRNHNRERDPLRPRRLAPGRDSFSVDSGDAVAVVDVPRLRNHIDIVVRARGSGGDAGAAAAAARTLLSELQQQLKELRDQAYRGLQWDERALCPGCVTATSGRSAIADWPWRQAETTDRLRCFQCNLWLSSAELTQGKNAFAWKNAPEGSGGGGDSRFLGELLNRKPTLASELVSALAMAPEPAGWKALAQQLTDRYPGLDGKVIHRYAQYDLYRAVTELLLLCGTLRMTLEHFGAALSASHNLAALELLRAERGSNLV